MQWCAHLPCGRSHNEDGKVGGRVEGGWYWEGGEDKNGRWAKWESPPIHVRGQEINLCALSDKQW